MKLHGWLLKTYVVWKKQTQNKIFLYTFSLKKGQNLSVVLDNGYLLGEGKGQ